MTWAFSREIASFNNNLKTYYIGYGGDEGIRGDHIWGQMLLPSISYEFVPFRVGTKVPYNAPVMTYTHENDPVHVIMKEEYYFGFGPYNPRSGLATMEYRGRYTHPTDVHILTFLVSPISKAWSDEGYYTYSGPITAIRIQHGITVTGIQCRFGAQWSAGFWSNAPGKTPTQVNLNQNEYIRVVAVNMLETLDSIMFITNIESYSPFGFDKRRKNETLVSRCGQVHHFSGYLQWDDVAQVNKTFSFAVHGDSCN